MTSEGRCDKIVVVGIGAQTAVGCSFLSAAAASRCGISGYAEHPYMRDRYGEKMVVARAPWLDASLALQNRFVELGVAASREALGPNRLPHGTRIRIHLALPAEVSGGLVSADKIADAILASARDRRLDNDVSLVLAGHAGGYMALAAAVEELRTGRSDACLVGGVDSYIDVDRLEALDAAGRLRSAHSRWGFTPGEAAGMCLLVRGKTAEALGVAPLAEIQAVATAKESLMLAAHQSINTGHALASVFRATLTAEERAHHTYCDLNGETGRADEFALALSRAAELFVDVSVFTAAADCWGDIGAASGPLTWALAVAAWQRGYGLGPVTLTCASSADGPLRGAARLGRVQLQQRR